MTSKERMLLALHGETPDRVPATIHQWQQFHLNEYMGGIDALDAFKTTGLDAAVQFFKAMGQFWVPESEAQGVQTAQWRDDITVLDSNPLNRRLRHEISTPGGTLSYETCGNRMTTWVTEHMIKRHEDVELIEKYMPVPGLDHAVVAEAYDEIGDAGILRGFVWGDQAGCWQHAACLMNPQTLIIEAMENPDWVHWLLRALLEKKLRFIEESLRGARFDIVETGGGAASDTLISPDLHTEFCLPYDREMHNALHGAGQLVVYHTCGGMARILDLIVQNECDASETLSPPGVGGNISDPENVREAFRGKIAMIGGLDQFNVLTAGTTADIRREVARLFEGFGKNGGYIMSTSDHFFDAPVENLKAYAEAAAECRY